MNITDIENSFKSKVCSEIRIIKEGVDRYKIFSPFEFEDGDRLVIVIKKLRGKYVLTDEGHTYMHLSYDNDISTFEKGTRAKIISSVISNFNLKEEQGSLIHELQDENDWGNSFYNYVQALIKITDVNYLSRERVKSTFIEDFKNFLSVKLPHNRIIFDYHDKKIDPDGKYKVDCKLNQMEKPLFIYGISNDDKCRDTTITLMQFEKLGVHYRSLAIFEDQEQINRKVLSRFSDICEKQFSSLNSNKERIEKYLSE